MQTLPDPKFHRKKSKINNFRKIQSSENPGIRRGRRSAAMSGAPQITPISHSTIVVDARRSEHQRLVATELQHDTTAPEHMAVSILFLLPFTARLLPRKGFGSERQRSQNDKNGTERSQKETFLAVFCITRMNEFRGALRAGLGHLQAVISPLGGSVRKPKTQAKTPES